MTDAETQDSVQFSVTRIGDDVFRVIAQSDKRILATWIVERKHVMERLAYEIEHLKIMSWELE